MFIAHYLGAIFVVDQNEIKYCNTKGSWSFLLFLRKTKKFVKDILWETWRRPRLTRENRYSSETRHSTSAAPLYLIYMKTREDTTALTILKILKGFQVSVTKFTGRKESARYYRCQILGNSSQLCKTVVRCVRCSNGHAKSCPRSTDSKIICCNCSGPPTEV